MTNKQVFEDTEALDRKLRRLPELEPPADMAAAIMLRTAQYEEKRLTIAHETPVREVPVREVPTVAPVRARSEWYAWAAMLAGIVVGLGSLAYGLFTGESALHFISPLLRDGVLSDGLHGLLEVPQPSPTVLVLAVGLILYTGGLFATMARPYRAGG